MEERRAAVFSRLAERHKSRTEQSLSRRSDADTAPSFENPQTFLRRFSDAERSIRSKLDDFRSVPSPPDEVDRLKPLLEGIAVAIEDLEKLLAENSYFLPSYDVRSTQKTIAELKERVESTKAQLLPRKKFSFGNKLGKTEKKPVTAGVGDTISRDASGSPASADANQVEGLGFAARETPGFRNVEGNVLVKDLGDSRDGDFAISDLKDSEVYLKGCSRAVFVHRLRDCRVFIGPVMGSVLIEDVEDCLFVVAAHQIRIHEAKRTDFCVRVRSKPIIEFCSGVRFAPYAFSYNGIENDLKEAGLGEETENWKNVEDFRWLRATPSPNWCIFPEEERIETVAFPNSGSS
ncbi:Tubulin-folding cofactor C [Nymphaea thermarum]|nr:Tubulin-folding cofactor C [Nymphaea thermarum]